MTHTEFILLAIGLVWLIVKIWIWVSRKEKKSSSQTTAVIPEYAVVRTLVAKDDDRGRCVPIGSKGTIVHVHQVLDGTTVPAYIVEVVLLDEEGMQNDAHVFTVLEGEVEVIWKPSIDVE